MCRKKVILSLMLVGFLCASCAGKDARRQAPAPETADKETFVEGFFTAGYGDIFFRPCGSTKIYHVEGTPQAAGNLELEYEEIQQGDYGELYVKFEGEMIGGADEEKRMNIAGAVTMNEVKDVHRVKDGDCGDSGVGLVAREDDSYVVTVEYPLMENKELEGKAAGLVAEAITTLKKTAGEPSPEERRYRLDVRYDTLFKTDRYMSLRFVFSFDTGGAHPNHNIACKNYDLEKGTEIAAGDVFKEDSDYVAKISDEVISALSGQAEGGTGKDWIQEGAGPDWKNFQCFTLSEKNIVFHFPPYQVASYAEGIKEAAVPFDKIRNVLKPPFSQWP